MQLTRLGVIVLVVIAVIAAAITFPAIQAGREAARRRDCELNVKLLTLALQNYHDTFLYLPYGARNAWRLNKGGVDQAQWGSSWLCAILPFRSGLFDKIIVAEMTADGGGYINPAVRARLDDVDLRYLICPSSPLPEWQRLGGSKIIVPHYAGIMGGASALNDPRTVAGPYGGFAAGNGMLLVNESLTMAAASDGTANTLIIGEVSSWYYTDRGDRRNATLSIGDAGDVYQDGAGWVAGNNLGFNGRVLSEAEVATIRRGRNTTLDSVPLRQGQFVASSEPPIPAHRVCNLITIRHRIGVNNRGGVKDKWPDWGTEGIGRCGLNNPLLSAHPRGAIVGYLDGHVQLLSKDVMSAILKKHAIRDDAGEEFR